MKECFELLLKHWREMSRFQKISLAGVAVVVFLGLIALIFVAGQSDFIVLFKGLELEEASAITKKLTDGGYGYRLADEGATVMVPASERAAIMLKLASDNALPNRSKGYSEIISETSIFNQSREMQELTKLRGLQGELERQLMQTEFIVRVRVHIFESPERAFAEDQKPDQAAVYLKLKPFNELTKTQVVGIRNLVSNATGIEPGQVKVIDQNLKDLSAELPDESIIAGVSSTQLDLQEQVSKTLEKSAQSLLDQVLGPGNAVARMHAELNFDQLEENTEKFAPPVEGEEGGIVISEEGAKETFEGKGKKPVAAAGADSNIAAAKTDDEKSKYDRNEIKKNYEVNSHKTRKIIAPGAISRFSLSIWIDKDSAIDDKLLEQAKKAIASAVGIDEKRGDGIALVRLPFNREFVKKQEQAFEKIRAEEFYTKLAGLLALALLALVLFIIVWRNRRSIADIVGKQKSPEAELMSASKEAGQPLTDEERAKRDINEKIKSFATQKPEDVAKILQIWLAEE